MDTNIKLDSFEFCGKSGTEENPCHTIFRRFNDRGVPIDKKDRQILIS